MTRIAETPAKALTLCFAILSSLLIGAGSYAQTLADLAGDWKGALSVNGSPVPLVLHLQVDDKGGANGTLDSPAQNAFGLPAEDFKLERKTFSFKAPSVGGSFSGFVNDAYSEIKGEWRQGPGALPLTLQRADAKGAAATPKAPARPQTPQPPFPYREENFTFSSADDGVSLAGTLTLPHPNGPDGDGPNGDGPYPAAVLISGSGPQDRDSEIFGHKPFLLLTYALTRAGIAVLRYDDRGTGASGGDFSQATTYDFADDARGAATTLKRDPRIDKARIALIGLSEGGVVAPIAHNAGADAAALVLLSAPILPYAEFIIDQVRDSALAAGASPAAAGVAAAQQQQIIDAALAAGEDPKAIASAVETALIKLGAPADQAKQQAAVFGSPWLSTYLRLDPRPELQEASVPTLALWGDKDVQVKAAKNAAALKSVATSGAVETVILPGLNHLLQPAETGAVSEYGQIETTMDEDALRLITDWTAQALAPK
ncbi:MAG: alpha/beta hydrolase [Pseudomonadota bacterium]